MSFRLTSPSSKKDFRNSDYIKPVSPVDAQDTLKVVMNRCKSHDTQNDSLIDRHFDMRVACEQALYLGKKIARKVPCAARPKACSQANMRAKLRNADRKSAKHETSKAGSG